MSTGPAVAPGLRIMAALRAGAVLAARPRGVVHVHSGAVTRTGLAVPGSARPVCGVRSRRLRVVGHGPVDALAAVAGRRFCRTCVRLLPARPGYTGPLTTRDHWLAAYRDHLTLDDLAVATTWTRTVEETHEIGALVLMLHGMAPKELHDAIRDRRRVLVAKERPAEEAARNVAYRKAEANDRALQRAAEKAEAIREKAQRRNRAGQYLMPWERAALTS